VYIKNDIISGKYKSGEKIQSLRNLAKQYSVSLITVNNAVRDLIHEKLVYTKHGNGIFVSENIKINKKERNVNKQLTVGFAIQDLNFIASPLQVGIIEGIRGILQKNNCDLQFSTTNIEYAKFGGYPYYMNLIESRKIDGLIIMDEVTDEVCKKIKEKAIPYITSTQPESEKTSNFITFDDYRGIKMAMDYLIETGHKKIAFIAGPEEKRATQQCVKSYIASLDNSGIKFNSPVSIASIGLLARGSILTNHCSDK